MTIRKRVFSTLLLVASAGALVACAVPGNEPVGSWYPSSYPAHAVSAQLGRVTHVEFLRGGSSSDNLAGLLIGGAAGGLVGNQVGGGSGRTAATVVGIVGGALIGSALEQNMGGRRGHDHYRVTVQLDNGAVQTFDYREQPNVRVGDRVRADGNQLFR